MANKGLADRVVVNQESILQTAVAFNRYVADNEERLQHLRKNVRTILEAGMQGGQADTANEALAALEKKLAGFHSDMSKIKLVLDQKCGMTEVLKQDKGLSAKVSDINATKTDKQITRK